MILKSSKKELVVSGCSMVADYVNSRNMLSKKGWKGYRYYDKNKKKYINAEWEYKEPFPIVVDILSEKYNMKPVDLAFPGSGNKQIYNRTMNYILENNKNIELVIVCWSSFTRIDFEVKINNNYEYKTLIYREYDKLSEINKETVHSSFYDCWMFLEKIGHIFPERDVNDFYRYSITLDKICYAYGIECIQCSSIRPFMHGNLSKKIILHPLFGEINSFNFYGWPIFPFLGGKTLCDTNNNIISKFDTHPNKKGHIHMANNLDNFIKERGIL